MATVHRLGVLGIAASFTWLVAQDRYVITTAAGGAPPPTPMPAVESSLGAYNVATDSAGNLYLAATNCVFKMDLGGMMTRVAGTCR